VPALPPLEAHEVEKIVNQPAHPIALFVNDPVVLLFGLVILDSTGSQDLAKHPNQARSFQFVADIADEVRLELDELPFPANKNR
jgi:hypothetical protein